MRTGSGLDREALGPLADRGVALLRLAKRPPIVTGGPCGFSEGRRRAGGGGFRVRTRARVPRRIIRACVTTPDRRKSVCRSKTTCTRPRTCGTQIDTAICVWIVAARARCVRIYIYIYIHIYIHIYMALACCNVSAWRTTAVPVSTCEYPLSGSAPMAWRRAAPTSIRRGSRRARPGRPSCWTSTCAYSQYSQYRPSPSAVAERFGCSGPARFRLGFRLSGSV